MLYHPDKNSDDPYALARFTEIKEAYEVLTNPQKKELYLQDRWLYKAQGKKADETLITAPAVLLKCLELNKQIAGMDIYRMNYKAVAERITTLLNDNTIHILLDQKETDVHASIVASMLKSIQAFPYALANPVAQQLLKLCVHLPDWEKHIQQQMQQKKQKEKWSWLNPLLIVLLTLAICLLIYFMGT